jgi:ribose-phosphate pyrophosphokinase
VVLVDDFTITGRTLITMAEALKERGAKDIYAAVTHGVLSEGAAQRIGESCIRKMFMTDTIESFEEVLPENDRNRPRRSALRSIHERTSVSQLFDQ